MEDPFDDILDRLITLQEELVKLQQINTLKTTKVEYELMILKRMVFNNIAKQVGLTSDVVESKHESMTHVAYLAGLDSILRSVPDLDETFVKRQLGIDD
jgi:hypothetical protein